MVLINSVLNKNTCAVSKLPRNLKIVGMFLAAILSNEELGNLTCVFNGKVYTFERALSN